MENLRNATCIPHISGKLIFGYILNLKSFCECEARWNMLGDTEKSKFIDIAKGIRSDVLLGLVPLQNWNIEKLELSQKELFYIANYPSQLHLFPYLSENEILQRCCKKLSSLGSEKRVFETIDKHLEKITKYTTFETLLQFE